MPSSSFTPPPHTHNIFVDSLGTSHHAPWLYSLPRSFIPPCDLSPQVKNNSKKENLICILAHSLERGQTLSSLPLQYNWVLSPCTTVKPPIVERCTWASSSYSTRDPFDDFLSRLSLFWGVYGGVRVGAGVVAEAFHVPLSQQCVCTHRYHHKSGFFALYSQREQRSRVSSWFLATRQTLNTPQLQQDHRLGKALGGSLDQGHQHGLRWQHVPLAVAQPTGVNMASGCSVCLSGVCGLWYVQYWGLDCQWRAVHWWLWRNDEWLDLGDPSMWMNSSLDRLIMEVNSRSLVGGSRPWCCVGRPGGVLPCPGPFLCSLPLLPVHHEARYFLLPWRHP